MLVAVLNCCTKEELEGENVTEAEDTMSIALESPSSINGDLSDRKHVIINKIRVIGRMARVFQLLRSVLYFLSNLQSPLFFYFYSLI